MTNAITTIGLTREFSPGVGAIDIEMVVPQGAIYGFLGPNGAGKSTTIRMLAGMLLPDRGTATVLGLDPATRSVDVKRRIGVLTGEQAIPRHHTGRSLLELLARLRDDEDVPDRGIVIANRLELDLDRPGHELSLGNKRKLGLVTALAHDPELVILDEPSSGLDPLLQRELEELLLELRARGRTVLLSSHSLGEVERVADHVGFIREGRLVEQSPVSVLLEHAVRRAVLRFPKPLASDAFEGVEGVVQTDFSDEGRTATVVWQGPVARLLKRAGLLEAQSIEARGADLEATFLQLYRDPETVEADQ